jgi:hypothetical protein
VTSSFDAVDVGIVAPGLRHRSRARVYRADGSERSSQGCAPTPTPVTICGAPAHVRPRHDAADEPTIRIRREPAVRGIAKFISCGSGAIS